MTPLGILRYLIKGLTGETSPSQAGGGLALGILLGLIPKANLTAQLILVLIMSLRVNVGIALVAATFASLARPVANLIADPAGLWLLTKVPALQPAWTYLYNVPVVPWTGFNNTLVIGNLALGLALFIPFYVTGKKLAVLYNSTIKERLAKSAFVKALKASWLLDCYFKYSG